MKFDIFKIQNLTLEFDTGDFSNPKRLILSMNVNKFLEQVREFGFGEDVSSYPNFSCNTIKKDEIIKIICETLLGSNTFPLNTSKIVDGERCGIGEGWIIRKKRLLGYELIQYGEASMCNYVVCWRKWFLTRRGVAREYIKRAGNNDIFLVISEVPEQ